MAGCISESFLLQRLALGRRPCADPIIEIVSHLSLLLNARQGSAPACPAYGLADLLPILKDMPNSRATLCESLRRAIVAHEPRLADVSVSQVDPNQGLQLQFSIEASVVASGAPILLRTRVTSGQHLEMVP